MIDAIIKLKAQVPIELVYCLIGWAVSIGITQPLKFAMPLKWHPHIRQTYARFLAFTAGFLTVSALLPTPTGLILGIVTGLWSPAAYTFGLFLIKHKWPWVADYMSGDVRGTKANRP